MNRRKKIGVFGGLFDPPHIGHLIIAQSILEEFNFEKIIFIPAGNPPHKRRYSPYRIRFHMTKLATEGNKKFLISNIEEKITGKTYTVEVIKELKRRINSALYLIIGSDQWAEIKTWKNPDELFKHCRVIVAPRAPYKIKKVRRLSNKLLIAHTPLINISSSDIRKRLKTNRSIQYLVPSKVHQYIKKKKLYQSVDS